MSLSLHASSGRGDVYTVEQLLDSGADVNAMDSDRCTALHLASAAGQVDVADCLLRRNADVNAADGNDETALQRACEHGHVELAELLLDWKARINVLGFFRMSPLHYAGANFAVLDTLLNRGADIECFDHNGLTVLHWAAKNGQTDVVAYFIDRGANVDARDHDGLTPLRYAGVAVAALLLEHGADIDARDRWNRTALWTAVDRGRQAEAMLLLRHGPALDGALHRAVANRDADLVTALLEAGAGPEEPDEDGWLPLHRATLKRTPTIIRLLIARGASVDGPTLDASAHTALQLAALDGDVEMSALLLAEGAHVEGRDARGRTALHAAAAGHVEVARLLLGQAGARVDAQDDLRWTSLAVAADGGWLAVARLLVTHGAAVDAGAGTDGLHMRVHHRVNRNYDNDDDNDDDDDDGDGLEIDGRSPLFRAAAAGHADIVELLLDSGAQPDVGDVCGWRAVHKASQLGHAAVVKVCSLGAWSVDEHACRSLPLPCFNVTPPRPRNRLPTAAACPRRQHDDSRERGASLGLGSGPGLAAAAAGR